MNMISGKWINPNDGTIINVTDTIIDDNQQMLLITDKGTLDMATFSMNFIQCDDTTLEELNVTKQTSKVEIDTSIYDELLTEPKKSSVQQTKQPTPSNTNNNQSIVEKLFNKIENKPQIKIEINWDDFPTDQVNTLINFLDVKREDISRYIMDKYLDEYSIIFALNDFLNKKIGEN